MGLPAKSGGGGGGGGGSTALLVALAALAALSAVLVALAVFQATQVSSLRDAVRELARTARDASSAAAAAAASSAATTCPAVACPAVSSAVVSLDPNTGGSPPSTFPQIGYLVIPAGAAGAQGAAAASWPLYGRSALERHGRWKYYTIPPGNGLGASVKLPVWAAESGTASGEAGAEGKDCMEDVACQRLSDGDTVNVPDAGVHGAVARVYKRSLSMAWPP